MRSWLWLDFDPEDCYWRNVEITTPMDHDRKLREKRERKDRVRIRMKKRKGSFNVFVLQLALSCHLYFFLANALHVTRLVHYSYFF